MLLITSAIIIYCPTYILIESMDGHVLSVTVWSLLLIMPFGNACYCITISYAWSGSEETKAACTVGPPIDSRGHVVAIGLVLPPWPLSLSLSLSLSPAAEEISDLIDASPSLESPLFWPLTAIAFVAMHIPGLLFPVATTGNSNAAEDFFFCRGPDFGHSAKDIFAEGQPSATSDLRQRLLRRGPDPRQRNALGQGPSWPSAKKGRSAVWAQSNGGSGR